MKKNEKLKIYCVDKSEENVEYNASNEFKRYYEYPDEFDFEFEENEEFILTLKVRYW